MNRGNNTERKLTVTVKILLESLPLGVALPRSAGTGPSAAPGGPWCAEASGRSSPSSPSPPWPWRRRAAWLPGPPRPPAGPPAGPPYHYSINPQ